MLYLIQLFAVRQNLIMQSLYFWLIAIKDIYIMQQTFRKIHSYQKESFLTDILVCIPKITEYILNIVHWSLLFSLLFAQYQ